MKFLIPSILGILLFMTPLSFNGEVTIPIAILSGWIQDLLADYLPLMMMIIIILTLAGTLMTKLAKPSFIMNSPFFKNLFDVTPAWVMVRVLGGLFAVSVYFEVGPEAIWSGDTGGLLLFDLLPVLFAVFLFAGLLLPLLVNFGLLEFFGSLLTKVMRPLFKLPGRSSVDAVTSWIGDGTIGVLLTSKQYEQGYYTRKEAAIIGTTFSVVSITFSLVIISQVGLERLFVPFYLTVLVSGVVAALIMPRIPPLSRKADSYYNDKKAKEADETIPNGYSAVSWGLTQAVAKAKSNKGIKEFFEHGMKNILDMWMGVAPVVMALGTLALVLAEYTPIFTWLGMPFIPILEFMGIPEAAAASETIFVGFADMFLPSVMAAGIESEMTRFVIATLSVSQLIYMSEVGGLLLGSKIPVSFWDLVMIFLLRTIITLPIIVLAAHILF
ncbi:YjiH family protein [Cytobacillus purgationiresistens]|uniref:Nucleoside recognition membrane protein YjiH n=1 Tax=Cytobacillus purgationiresistens TaxID=863449 RepID=A0ABU0AKN4_9BACI|nr:YjiH family protein [Cytobacillus purgationiresistens]MDQ0271823.1 nucleoside recognition membrane protein YjiH [Cytobacillus purgationiresistens]